MIIRQIKSSLTITILTLFGVVHGAATCYFPNGLPSTDDTFQPCNASASGSSYSTCCNLGKESSDGLALADTCLTDGLCMAANPLSGNGLFFATGCTDPTMKDGSCPQMCAGETDSTHETYALNPCPDGKWCCLPWGGVINSTCCVNGTTGSFDFDILSLRALNSSTTGSSSSNTASSAVGAANTSPCAAYQCPSNNTFTVGMGVGLSLGITLLAALAAIAILLRRLKTVQQQGVGQIQEMPAQWGRWSIRRGGTVPVELPVEQKYAEAPPNEIDGGRVNGWNEERK